MNEEVRKYLAGIGAKGGSQKSATKASSSRANGAKGGRPRLEGKPPIRRKEVQ